MKIYFIILGLALAILTALAAVGYFFLHDYVTSIGFAQNAYVEALSFVITTALIGSVSAAVISYVNESKAKPVRAYAIKRIGRALSAVFQQYGLLLKQGDPKRNIADYTRVAVAHQRPLTRYLPRDIEVEKRVGHIVATTDRAKGELIRFGGFFPVDVQDEISGAIDTLDRLSFAANLLTATEKYPIPEIMRWTNADRPAPVAIMRSLRTIAESARIEIAPVEKCFADYEAFLSSDLQYLVAIAYNNDLATLHPAEPWKLMRALFKPDAALFVDLEETISDEEARLMARLPRKPKNAGEMIELGWFETQGSLAVCQALKRALNPWVDRATSFRVDWALREKWPPR